MPVLSQHEVIIISDQAPAQAVISFLCCRRPCWITPFQGSAHWCSTACRRTCSASETALVAAPPVGSTRVSSGGWCGLLLLQDRPQSDLPLHQLHFHRLLKRKPAP